MYSTTAGDDEVSLVSNSNVDGNPLRFEHYSLDNGRKGAVDVMASSTLFRRSGTWLRANKNMLFSEINFPEHHPHIGVTITAMGGASAPATMGYSNFNNGG